MKHLLTFLLFILVVGCSSVSKDNQTATNKLEEQRTSPIFLVESNKQTLEYRGELDKLAINNTPISSGKEQKIQWYVWIKDDQDKNSESGKLSKVGSELKVIGINKESNEKIDVNENKLIELSPSSRMPNGHQVLTTEIQTNLPTKGLWNLSAYIGDQHLGDISVEVK